MHCSAEIFGGAFFIQVMKSIRKGKLMTSEKKDHHDNPEGYKAEANPSNQDHETQKRTQYENLAGPWKTRPGVKFILIGLITVALLIPSMLVWGLVEERSIRAQKVSQSISKGWGGSQTINGPYLVIPYRISERVNNKMVRTLRHAIISPELLKIDGITDVEERKKSIYKTQLYHLKMSLNGRFETGYLDELKAQGASILEDAAFLGLGVSDMTGFRSDVMVAINTEAPKRAFSGLGRLKPVQTGGQRHYTGSGPANLNRSGGVHLPVKVNDLETGFSFEISLALNGSRALSVIPSGKTTEYALASNWPHPGFDGTFLPETRNINFDGFTSHWTVPSLARGINGVHLGNSLPGYAVAMKVNFVEPLQFYQVVSRTLKFSIGMFSLIFLALFVLELNGKKTLHWIQYVLVGFALVVFYVLLLALAEHIGFAWAYLCSAFATSGLITWYVGDALGNRGRALIVAGVMTLSYLLLYLILNEADHALLAGAIVAFAAISITMFATRSVDWASGKRLKA